MVLVTLERAVIANAVTFGTKRYTFSFFQVPDEL